MGHSLVVTAALEGEAAEWVVDLYTEHAQEFGDADLFLESLRDHFKDVTQAQLVEGEILALKKRGRLVADYVQEFCRITSKLRPWLEWLLIHHLKADLDHTLHQACAYRGFSHQFNER